MAIKKVLALEDFFIKLRVELFAFSQLCFQVSC